MKDGYYLSTYLYIDELSHLINVGSRHDQNISLFFKKGNTIELIRLWEIERFTGIKMHRRAFYNVQQANEMINYLLSTVGLSLTDIHEVWGTKELQTNEFFHSIDDYKNLSYHNVSHLFSSILLDTNLFHDENVIGLSVDGGPDGVLDPKESEKNYYTGCYKDKEKFELFPVHSPGLLWHLLKKKLKMREGSLMALGSASTSTLLNDTEQEVINITNRKSFSGAVEYIDKLFNKVTKLTEKESGILFNYYDERFTTEENKISMIVKEVQKMSIKIMERNIDEIIMKYNVEAEDTYLALSGGFILNCPTNSYLMNKYKFKGMIAPPFVSDCGLSFGMGMYTFYKRVGEKISFKLHSAFYGNCDQNLDKVLSNRTYTRFIEDVSDLNVEQVVYDIIAAPIVWFDGQAEVGPRALGNRSLLADPRTNKSKDILNNIKAREWWRPVAPIILKERVEEWFEDAYASPYMLNTFMIKEDKLSSVPSIAHLDNSARVQTIDIDTHPTLYRVIEKFLENTGVPIVCNTSLNDAGEPIINTIEEALNFALRKNIKIVYANGMRIELKGHHLYENEEPLPRFEFELFDQETSDELLKALNPFEVPMDVLKLLKVSLEFNYRVNFNLSLEEDVKKLLRLVSTIQKSNNHPAAALLPR